MNFNKKIFLAIFAVFVTAAIVYQIFLKKEESDFNLAEVVLGDITQEISETGQVQKGEKINLSFKNAGRIEKIYVQTGKKVGPGDILAKLETAQLAIQLQEEKSSLDEARAKLDKLLAGASQEEIKIAQTKVDNSQIALDIARQNEENVYEDAINVLNDAYLKSYNARNSADYLQRTYFINFDQESIRVKESKDRIDEALSQIKIYLAGAQTDSTHENINLALKETKYELSVVSGSLKNIREACENVTYRNAVSSADKTSLDTHRLNINEALTGVVDAQQLIISKSLAVKEAGGDLQKAQDELASLLAPPRKEDLDLYRAQVGRADSQVRLLENQIQDAYLRGPVAGQVAEVKKREGEVVQPSSVDGVILLVPAALFEIKVDIYEEDVVKMAAGNLVDISLIAFPGVVFKGKVAAINPAEKLKDGVVYYETTVVLEETPENIKPGMTADLVIKTALRENVLMIPERAVKKENGKTKVSVLTNHKEEEREIQTGLLGGNGMVEVESGLKQGEKVILR